MRPKQAEIQHLLAEETHLLPRLCPSTLHRMERGASDFVILDLVDSDPLGRPGAPISTGMLGNTMPLLNTVFTHARGKLVVLANLDFLNRTLSSNSAVHCFLEQMKLSGVVFKTFPFETLRTGAPPDIPGITFYRDTNVAWNILLADLSKARLRALWNWPDASIEEVFNDDFVCKNFPQGVKSVVAGPASHAARKRFKALGVSVEPVVAPDFLLQIDDGVFWFIGRSHNGKCNQPFVRVKGERAPFFLARFSGLDHLISSPTKWIPPISKRPTGGPLSAAEMEELKILQEAWNEVRVSGKSISREMINRFVDLNDRLSDYRAYDRFR